ncbi:uncharacterized protein LOC118782643 [Megalops cyprinoides]|uniref:uncharacterized protein LOC118782643 n=1 Tax=Megalops cyprinoides TaxID=118141 RepID=UPI0018653E70|nr:uncharacterized protein LOC118782643 [Megalops cyprinoides]
MDQSCVCLSLCFAALLGVATSSTKPSTEPLHVTSSHTSRHASTKTISIVMTPKNLPVTDATIQAPDQPPSAPQLVTSLSTANDAPQNCFISNEWTIWVLVAAGAAVAIPLICAMGLMIQVCRLKRQVRPGRTPRTNVDLVSGMRSPSTTGGGAEGGASAGLCESAIKMEEVKLQEQAKEEEAREEEAREEAAKDGTEQGAVDKAGDSGNGEAARESTAPATASSQMEGVPAAAAEGEMEVLVVV